MIIDHLDILRELISFKSITPKGIDALEYIESLLKKQNFECEIKSFGTGKEKTHNLYARFSRARPNICFAGHVDVVPPGNLDKWSYDPFTMHKIEDTIYGRGIVDMKGALAAALAASLNFIEVKKSNNKKFKGSISFLLTSDEEGTGKYGTCKMLEYINNKYLSNDQPIDFCILGEPTSEQKVGDIVKIGRRGSINFDLVINGYQGHVAYSDKTTNPINIMVKTLHHLQNIKLDKGTTFFQSSNLEVTSIDTNNQTRNIIPDKCSAKFNIRFNDLFDEKKLVDLIRQEIIKYHNNFTLDHHCSSKAFNQKHNNKFQEFINIIKKTTNIETIINNLGGTSDARFIYKYAPVIEFGLKNAKAHKTNECCNIYDLQMLYKVYYSYLAEYL